MEAYYEFERPIANLEKKITDLRSMAQQEGMDFGSEITALQQKLEKLIQETYANLSPWQRVQLSRHPQRPYAQDYIDHLIEDFQELHGDRKFRDDAAIIGGLGKFRGRPILLIAQQKGRGTKEKMKRNFGMAKPEGYRKAIRLMEMADRFSLPILTLVDTPGAYPGIDAEERGQSEAIADSIMRMFGLKVPVISVVIGEGGSGGALAVAVANVVLMQEFSTYSVISPESCASILWSDSSMSEQASKVLRLSAPEVLSLGVIDKIIEEPKGGAHRDHALAAKLLGDEIHKQLEKLTKEDLNLDKSRLERFRSMGSKYMISAPV
ncbi:MAG: acetyl-CoA carboxylase carboxyltransferase subunit alpha [Oligoflexia bacterium]|nr:acetyl-CoA carboxylase carboxyltransferase subunit alpha [Oligoflexia bacterium]